MSSYFTLELDTTSPSLEIFAPDYTMKDTETEIRITANENLSTFQEIYIIDSLGQRHDHIFAYQGNVFAGILNFNNFPSGPATIYAYLKDDLYNLASITKTIAVISDQVLKIITDELSNKFSLREYTLLDLVNMEY
ncbi:MAG: hypothetical protein ACOWWO_11920 [Peptococcaceae bacterium]